MRIGIVAGEASGDLLGAGLIKALRGRLGDVHFEGVAGPAMQAAGCEVLEESAALAVMGLIEPLKEIPRLLRLRKMLLTRWQENPPAAVIGIDAPDFNLGLELRLRRAGIKTIHYVSPSVWAWRQGRIHKIRKAVDRVLCLLPFEKAFYDEHDVAADFVGHPMAERISANPDMAAARERLQLDARYVVGVLPGSRLGEVEKLGPDFIAACKLLASQEQTADIVFVSPMATDRLRDLFAEQLQAAGMRDRFVLLRNDSEAAVTAADVVLLASGTATLETALLATPMVAAYRVAGLTFRIGQIFDLLKTPYISLPNLLTPQPWVPEYTQDDVTPAALCSELSALLLDRSRRTQIVEAFSSLRGLLAQGADERAADSVLDVIGQPKST